MFLTYYQFVRANETLLDTLIDKAKLFEEAAEVIWPVGQEIRSIGRAYEVRGLSAMHGSRQMLKFLAIDFRAVACRSYSRSCIGAPVPIRCFFAESDASASVARNLG